MCFRFVVVSADSQAYEYEYMKSLLVLKAVVAWSVVGTRYRTIMYGTPGRHYLLLLLVLVR
eukprot:scaffold390057_cov15-Prasinocladus_malaysianus.AAC.1